MKILVTGGAGFIGSHLVEHYQGRAEIVVLDNLRTGDRRKLAGLACCLVEGSILDAPLVRELMTGVDYVFHLAAMVSVPESMADPLACAQLNTTGTLVVLEAAAKAGVKKLCFSSSSAVYGDAGGGAARAETDSPAPVSPYGASKLAAEAYCIAYARAGWLPTACLRYFNVFGPRQDPHSAYAAAVPAFLGRASRGEDLLVYGDGEQTRDFIYVRDVAAANAHFAASPHQGVFNVARGETCTINDLARTIVRLSGATGRLRHVPPRAGDIRHSRAAVAALQAAGFRAATTLEDGLRATLAASRGAGD